MYYQTIPSIHNHSFCYQYFQYLTYSDITYKCPHVGDSKGGTQEWVFLKTNKMDVSQSALKPSIHSQGEVSHLSGLGPGVLGGAGGGGRRGVLTAVIVDAGVMGTVNDGLTKAVSGHHIRHGRHRGLTSRSPLFPDRTQDTYTYTQDTHTYTQDTHTYTQDTHTYTQDTHTYIGHTHVHTGHTHVYTHVHTGHVHTGHTHVHTGHTHTYTQDTHTRTHRTHTRTHTRTHRTHTRTHRTHTRT